MSELAAVVGWFVRDIMALGVWLMHSSMPGLATRVILWFGRRRGIKGSVWKAPRGNCWTSSSSFVLLLCIGALVTT
jgi:hypothetical protein